MTRHHTRPPSQRQLKVAELIKSEVSVFIFKNELSLPLLDSELIAIPEVRISPDLKIATIFVTTYTNQNSGLVVDMLNSHVSIIRRSITPRLNLKYSPEIRFIKDDVGEKSAYIDKLLHNHEKKQ